MSAMNEFFGDVYGRPDHPDFWKLSEVLLSMDAETDTPGGFEKAVADANVDVASLTYVALQRARRAYLGDDPAVTMAFCAVWLDGFIAGQRYGDRVPS